MRNNTTTTTSTPGDLVVPDMSVVVSALIFLVGLAVITLNVVVIRTLRRRERTYAVYLLLNLAVSDVLSGFSDIYSSFYRQIGHQFYNSTSECLARQGLVLLGQLSSLFHLNLLTIERYMTVVHPYRHFRIVTLPIVRVASYASWVVALAIVLAPSFLWRNWHQEQPTHCHVFDSNPREYTAFLTATVLVSFLVIILLYVRIYLTARRHIQSIARQTRAVWSTPGLTGHPQEGAEGQQTPHISRGAMQFTKTTTIIVGAFAVCWAPGTIMFLLDLSGRMRGMGQEELNNFILICICCVLVNSLVNPIIYAAKMADVRRALLQLVVCRHRKRRAARSSMDTL